jgi:hypothetical protein
MAVTLETIKDEVLSDLQESTTATRPLYTSADFVSWANRLYDQYGARMKLQGVTTYTWTSGTTSVAMSTIAATMKQINYIEVLDSEGEVVGTLRQRPKGSSDGYYIWNNTVYLNTTAPTTDENLKFYYYRKPAKATAISDNADIHEDYERSVLNPWFLYNAYRKAKKFGTAEGFLTEFREAFRAMMSDRGKQVNTDTTRWEVSDDWVPYTG